MYGQQCLWHSACGRPCIGCLPHTSLHTTLARKCRLTMAYFPVLHAFVPACLFRFPPTLTSHTPQPCPIVALHASHMPIPPPCPPVAPQAAAAVPERQVGARGAAEPGADPCREDGAGRTASHRLPGHASGRQWHRGNGRQAGTTEQRMGQKRASGVHDAKDGM